MMILEKINLILQKVIPLILCLLIMKKKYVLLSNVYMTKISAKTSRSGRDVQYYRYFVYFPFDV